MVEVNDESVCWYFYSVLTTVGRKSSGSASKFHLNFLVRYDWNFDAFDLSDPAACGLVWISEKKFVRVTTRKLFFSMISTKKSLGISCS